MSNNIVCIQWQLDIVSHYKGEDYIIGSSLQYGKMTENFTGKPIVSERLFKYVLTPVVGWRIKEF